MQLVVSVLIKDAAIVVTIRERDLHHCSSIYHSPVIPILFPEGYFTETDKKLMEGS